MREILFKGKRVDNGEWLEGFLFVRQKKTYYIQSDSFMLQVTPETVCQFTGITDKNGKKVFEGDIMKSIHFKEGRKTHYLNHIVSWSERLNGWFAVNTHNKTDSWEVAGNIQLFVFTRHGLYPFEVIGNIHDSHKLL